MTEARNPPAVAINPDRVTVDGAGNVLVAAHGQGRLKRRRTWMPEPHIMLVDEVGYEELTTEQVIRPLG